MCRWTTSGEISKVRRRRPVRKDDENDDSNDHGSRDDNDNENDIYDNEIRHR